MSSTYTWNKHPPLNGEKVASKESKGSRRSRWRDLPSFLLVGLVGYLVLGSMLDGYSEVLPKDGPVAVGLFVGLLALLFLVEGLEVSVVKLSASLDNQKVSAFLAGRQLFTVMVIFLLAGLSTFPAGISRLPFLPVALPTWSAPILSPMLNLGLGGSLLVLWFGQQSAKLTANKYPQKFMDFPLGKVVFGTSTRVGKTSIVAFAVWLSGRIIRTLSHPSFLRDTEGTFDCDFEATMPEDESWPTEPERGGIFD